jgi:hypothetical protein
MTVEPGEGIVAYPAVRRGFDRATWAVHGEARRRIGGIVTVSAIARRVAGRDGTGA